mmetsp:Transcript_61135/g.101264  ORF Transcript_61135/g.101264 Transcript_61135/m.101264 type:complete len:86 (+) Transcript_61135:246-503(+)
MKPPRQGSVPHAVIPMQIFDAHGWLSSPNEANVTGTDTALNTDGKARAPHELAKTDTTTIPLAIACSLQKLVQKGILKNNRQISS